LKSLVLTRDGLQLADTPIPTLMPGYVRIEMRSVGVCTTDINIWRGEISVDLPLVLGHEISGVVHESSVPEICAGSMVTSEVDITCGRCWYCTHNQKQHCSEKSTIGIDTDGGLSEYLCVPAENIHILPDGVDILSGTFVEPLATAIEAYNRSPVTDNEPVLVMGDGKLGILVAQVYDAFGADVYLLGTNQWKLGAARQLGLRNAINVANPDWKRKILDITHGVGPRVIVESTNNIDGLRSAFDVVRSRGIITTLSMHGFSMDFKPTDIVDREITLIGVSRGEFPQAIDMLAKGRIMVKKLVTKEFSLDDGAEAFAFATKPDANKIIINI
jgi:threonine dehydrogenase-like Zn-dependent dehydrogenase